jgi:methylamine dehydrogenase heavy chain
VRVPPRPRRLLAAALLASLAGAPAAGELPIEPIGRVESLRAPLSPHLVWASDALLRRIALADLGSGDLLGVIDGGYGIPAALFARGRPEIYVPATHYSRGSRGERSDVVTVYDALSLAPLAEVGIPPRRAINQLPSANEALSDDGRFALVFNMTPATSVSVVDLERRAFVGEIATPGCSLVYAAGPRRFVAPCADGSLLVVTLDEAGREAAKARTRPFFDPQSDPVTEKAVRRGDEWLFVSFAGRLHAVDVSGAEPRFAEPWDLVAAEERAQGWRIGGHQHLAVHAESGRLYALVHQGPPDTHKEPGSELWVYDLASRRRVQRIELRSPGFTYLGELIDPGPRLVWPLRPLYEWALSLAGIGVGLVAVTQDERPLLVTAADFSGALAVYDALSGEFLRRLAPGNLTTLSLRVPWETVEAAR